MMKLGKTYLCRYAHQDDDVPAGWVSQPLGGHHGANGYVLWSKDMPDSPFKLPEGNVQISFSGGRTSAYMLHEILQANGDLPERCRVLFQNTGREMPQTLEFVNECAHRWGVDIIWLEYDRVDNKPTFKQVDYESASMFGEPFELLVQAKRVLPNTLMRFCTVELKINTAKRYLKSIGWETWQNAVGIRADEPNRFKKAPKKDCWVPWRPLVDAGVHSRMIAEFWDKQDFRLHLPVVNGKTMYGNCDGCFLKSESQLAMLAKDYPSKLDWWIRLEKMHEHRGDYGFFNKNRPLALMKEFVEMQQDWVFDEVGYFCQADGGECTGD